MQTLGISTETPQSDGRLKSIFWPTIHSGADVDTLGIQGFWICTVVGVLSLITSTIVGQPIVGVFMLAYFYLGGVGVRQHNLYSAIAVFIMYFANVLVAPGVVNIFVTAVLLSTVRATFIASFWEPETVEAEMPIRLNETWGDKFSDQWPKWLWPKIYIGYYIYSAGFLFLVLLGVVILILRRFGIVIPFAHRR